jgi:osmotically-inducible protein OsmY
VGVALWAWRNRDEIFGWAGFAVGSVPKLVDGSTGDVLTEARLRARLTADARTRRAQGLRVSVVDGIVVLAGVVDPLVHDVALDLATSTTGVTRVRDDLSHPSRRFGSRTCEGDE